jgi:hypothetical protein
MKHLKSFNEDITSFNFEEELKDFCETNLAYLLDEGTEVLVGETQNGNIVKIKFDKMKSWDEIKDHIIPFATRLNNKYEMEHNPMIDYDNVRFWTYTTRSVHKVPKELPLGMVNASITRKIENLINDDIWVSQSIDEMNLLIKDIDIYIKGYKQEPKKGVLTKIKSFFK